jgi:hypothetical protein
MMEVLIAVYVIYLVMEELENYAREEQEMG